MLNYGATKPKVKWGQAPGAPLDPHLFTLWRKLFQDKLHYKLGQKVVTGHT